MCSSLTLFVLFWFLSKVGIPKTHLRLIFPATENPEPVQPINIYKLKLKFIITFTTCPLPDYSHKLLIAHQCIVIYLSEP